MTYHELSELKKKVQKELKKISDIGDTTLENYINTFDIEYTHHSTAIEGNSLTLLETKVVLEDGISIGGKELREIYEVINHNQAFQYIKQQIHKGMPLSEEHVKEMHKILTEKIMNGGVYRTTEVTIGGANHEPPDPQAMIYELKNFYTGLMEKSMVYNPVELAAWTHAEFVRIHPFRDGNGRTARLLLNYQLMESSFAPVNIKVDDRFEYYKALDEYATTGNLQPFIEIIMGLEEKQLKKYLKMIPQKLENGE